MNANLYGPEGFIYVLSNPSFHGMLKIGVTRVHPLQRIQQLSAASGVPTPFELAYFRDFNDAFRAESIIHNTLASYRVNESREFFKISVEETVKIIDKVAIGLRSQGIIGGGRIIQSDVATPWAELFSTFPDRGDGMLNEEEMWKCKKLRQHLNQQ